MSIREYLADLSLDQLNFAKTEAERLIKNISDRDRVTLWLVRDAHVNVACYPEGKFEDAKAKVCELIMSCDFKPGDVAVDHPRINRLRVYPAEVRQWMLLNR